MSSHMRVCPFCGIAPSGIVGKGMIRSVGCFCGAYGPLMDSNQDAIEAWNQRVRVPARRNRQSVVVSMQPKET